MDFMERIESIQTNPNVSYDAIAEDIQSIVELYEHNEKRIYDLEHDLKLRDETVEELKKQNYDLSTKKDLHEETEETEETEEEIETIDDDDIIEVKE